MRVFVGFGYNERDKWIEEQVFPVLQSMGFTVVHGKDLHGQILQQGVKDQLDQSDAAVGFFTIREGQGDADFTSHIWVRDEMVYFSAKDKPIVPIKEENVKVPRGLLGDRQYIVLRQNDRLACVVELVRALGRRNIRRIRLEPQSDRLTRDLHQWRKKEAFSIQYRTRSDGLDSTYSPGRLEVVDQGFYMNAVDVPDRAQVEVEGFLNGDKKFSSGWASADAVMVKIN
ncbi:MAG: hypothetical protein ACRD9S_04615 [Pyrinomonadaceae bacterium]